jgi:hypothetical protein
MALRPDKEEDDITERYEVIGVTSFGSKCGQVGVPGE